MGAKYIIFLIISLKQIFLGTTEFGGHCPQLPGGYGPGVCCGIFRLIKRAAYLYPGAQMSCNLPEAGNPLLYNRTAQNTVRGSFFWRNGPEKRKQLQSTRCHATKSKVVSETPARRCGAVRGWRMDFGTDVTTFGFAAWRNEPLNIPT